MAVTELEGGGLQGDSLNFFGFSSRPSSEDLDRPARVSHMKALARTIEGEIIPRLLLVYSGGELRDERDFGGRVIVEDDVAFFADMVLLHGPAECIAHAESILDGGASIGSLFLDLLAPSARRLGVLWTEDLRSFTDVTIGLGILQQVFRHFCPTFEGGAVARPARHAFLVPAPGEQHTFGLFVLETFLHRAGWRVDALPSFDLAEVVGFLRTTPVNLVCISANCDRFLAGTKSAIASMREASMNRQVVIMAGGTPFNALPDLVREVGADATACDAKGLVEHADMLVPLPPGDEHHLRMN